MSLFDDIKERLTMRQVAEMYGLDVNRSGFCNCPFHNEKTPSMKIYEKGYKCFGCGEGGDIIKFVQKYFNISPIDACHKLNDDFRLGLETISHQSTDKQSKTMLLHQRRQDVKDKAAAALNIVSDYLNVLNGYRINYQPHDYNEIPDKRFFEYLSDYENTLVLYESLVDASELDFNEKERFYADKDLNDSLSSVLEKLNEANNIKRHEQEQAYQFSEGQIIGNTAYRDISSKAYLKYNNIISPMIAKGLDKFNIKYSGKVYSKLTTFTFNAKDIDTVRAIADSLSRDYAKLNRNRSAEHDNPKLKKVEKSYKPQPTKTDREM